MMALTVQQPWAWSIFHAGKSVENRSNWRYHYRGPVAIHAGQRWSNRGSDNLEYRLALAREQAAVRHRIDIRGAIIGLADLVDVHPAADGCCKPWGQDYVDADGDISTNLIHLTLENPVAIEPVACRGALGLWTMPDRVNDQVCRSLSAVYA